MKSKESYLMKLFSKAVAVNGAKLAPRGLLLALALALMRHDATAAQDPVSLGSASTYGVLAGSTVTSTGATKITGDLGLSPGTAVTGAPTVTGTVHAGDAAAAKAQTDLTAAYIDAAGRAAGAVTVSGNIGGQTLGPGIYRSASSLEVSSGDLTLAGDANAVWIFQMGSTLVTTVGRRVLLSGGAQAANVFWQVGSSATIGAGSEFKGTIMAAQSITMVTGAILEGRALARAAAVTLDANTVTVPRAANPAGTVAAWGDNSHGQTSVPAGLRGVTAIAAGHHHTLALKRDGTVAVWGDNTLGQTTLPDGLADVTAIAAGDSHSLALKRDGTIVAWGDNSFGQTTIPAGLTGVTAISGGDHHTVVLKSNGTLVAWGDNTYGQTTIPDGLTGVIAIAAGGGHTVALKNNSTVVAWGADGFFHQATVPAGLSGVTAIAAGGSHTVALKSNGKVVAWGNGIFLQNIVPAGLSGVTAIAAGGFHTVALKSDGTVVAWGWDETGQATVSDSLGGVTAIAAGYYSTVALISPIISKEPLAQTFPSGGGITLSVNALGSALTYQWQFNGANIPGATGSTLDLQTLSAANAGTYRVVVTSAAGGAATSQGALLKLLVFGDLKFYAGITLEGTVGQQFRVDYADAVNVGKTNWLTLSTIILPSSPYLVIDPNSPDHSKRFYRATPLP